ncbi:GntR family transcriptional regulator [Nitratireductor sp. XY-223]|uniref:GntR family transcriptional regulator n=1 Tax=Nitratireductor sp. XY-223 TaxID=2561926 RepID=UPI0010AABDCD|nr:GntR family transcriptional regulator [Nitratireductor sp. XY-223]
MSSSEAIPIDPSAPRYAVIEKLVEAAIERGTLPARTVLMEGPIAKLFGTSRTPVRVALNSLCDRGLLLRFEGRGFVVPGDGDPVRAPLTGPMLGLPEDVSPDPAPVTSQRIARDFETVLVHALPFGRFGVNEQAMADHYNVSRTVVRELLSRLQDRGLINKNRRSHWVIGPLTAREVAQYFAIRSKLEPLALEDSAPRLPARDIKDMWGRLQTALDQGDDLSSDTLEELESDMHVRLLAGSNNSHLLRMVHQSQLALVVNRVFASFIGTGPFKNSLREHAIVFEFIMRGAYEMAAQALEEHLNLAARRTRQRLMTLSVFPEPEFPRYLVKRAS